jgi:cytochrome c oxidase subunit 2
MTSRTDRRAKERGSTAAAAMLALIIVVMTVITVYIFVEKIWWFPPTITDEGALFDSQFSRTLWITGVIFIAAQFGLALVIFRSRDRGQRARHFEGHNGMEVLWTTATLILFVGLGIYAEKAWAEVHFIGAEPGALPIEVTGQQFAWNFRYTGPDGVFGRTRPDLVSASTGNAVGVDPTDPAGKDDIISPGTIAVPAGREVDLIIKSLDVTHSFFVRELRLKQDAVPGMTNHLHFTANTPGTYEVACAELCGLGHYKMRATMIVMSEADFEKWIQQQEAANQ